MAVMQSLVPSCAHFARYEVCPGTLWRAPESRFSLWLSNILFLTQTPLSSFTFLTRNFQGTWTRCCLPAHKSCTAVPGVLTAPVPLCFLAGFFPASGPCLSRSCLPSTCSCQWLGLGWVTAGVWSFDFCTKSGAFWTHWRAGAGFGAQANSTVRASCLGGWEACCGLAMNKSVFCFCVSETPSSPGILHFLSHPGAGVPSVLP